MNAVASMRTADPFESVEAGEPARDLRAFRRSLGHFATGVTVIAAQSGARPFGMTANSFASVSLDPPLVSVCIARTARSLSLFLEASHFAVNVLTADQVDIANRFVQPGIDRFSTLAWRPGCGGAPVLGDVSACFECVREAAYEGGDHMILLGRVLRFARSSRAPLLFAHGRYGQVADSFPAFTPHASLQASDGPPQREFMLTWLRRARDRLSSAFEIHRVAVGLTLNQARVLIYLDEHGPATLDAIARDCLLGPVDAEDVLASLIAQQDVFASSDTRYGISAKGREHQRDLLHRAATFESEQLAQLPAADVEATSRVLRWLAGSPVPRERGADEAAGAVSGATKDRR